MFVRSLFCLALFLLPAASASGQVPEGPDFLQDIELGARLESGLYHGEQTMLPIQERSLRFLGRPVSPQISFNVPLYGISAGLRFRGAELLASYRTTIGTRLRAYLLWQDGEAAIPATSNAWEKAAHLQYFVTERLGVGLRYRDRLTSLTQVNEFELNGESTSSMLFDYTRHYRTLSLYVPIRYGLTEEIMLDAELGISVYGHGNDFYSMDFAARQESLTEVDPDIIGSDVTKKYVQGTDLNTQFGEVGLSYPIGGMPLRFALKLRRLVVPEMTETWLTGASLRFGLPF